MTVEPGLARGVCPSRDQVLEEVRQIVAEQMGLAPEKIRQRDTLIGDLGCDSLDVVEITMEVEDHFDTSVSDEIGEQIRTIGDVADAVMQLLSRQTAE